MASYTARYPTDRPDGNMPQRRAGIAAPSTLAGVLDNLWTSINNFNVLLLPRRIHFFELEDLDICPPFLRERAQATLTGQWTRRLPILQRAAPATLAAEILQDLILKLEASSSTKDTDAHRYDYYQNNNLSIASPDIFASAPSTPDISSAALSMPPPMIATRPRTTAPQPPAAPVPLEIIDFCAGAGGPTPYIEREVNTRRLASHKSAINFLLTDLHPHISAWIPLASRSATLNFVPQPVDAAAPSRAVISQRGEKRVVRTFYLSFHHFDDPSARAILKSTLETSDAFAIIELMDRRLFSLLLLALEPILIYLVALAWFGGDWIYLFFTFCVPAMPILMGWDGIVSLLRARTFDEIVELADQAMGWHGKGKTGYGTWLSTDGGNRVVGVEREGWVLESGRRLHTWPLGYAHYVTGRRI